MFIFLENDFEIKAQLCIYHESSDQIAPLQIDDITRN